MSFAQNFGDLLKKPNDDLVAKEDVPWWLKYSARGLGTFAGGFAIFFGIFNVATSILTIEGIRCTLTYILVVILAFTVLVFEAPYCCMFLDYVQEGSKWIENRPYWNRAAYYMIGSAILFLMCLGISQFLCCGFIFTTGLLYGMMALGKKAPREEMRNNAATVYSTNNQQFPPAASSNSNLVEGAQPTAMTNPFNSRA